MGKRPIRNGTPGELPPRQQMLPGLERDDGPLFRLGLGSKNDVPPEDAAANHEEARGPRLSNLENLERWLVDKPPEWATVMAVRAALRSIPALAGGDEVSALSAFRAVSAAWVATVIKGLQAKTDQDFALYLSKLRFAPHPDRPGIQSNLFKVVFDVLNSVGPDSRIHHMSFASRAITRAAEVAVVIAHNATAANDFWHAVESDARVLEAGRQPKDVARDPLWPGFYPNWVTESWSRLKNELLLANSDWEVWRSWYNARLDGGPIEPLFEIARVWIADEIWKQGPRAVNAEITQMIETRRPREPDALSTPESGADANDDPAGWKVAIIDGPNLPISDWLDAAAVFEQGSPSDRRQAEHLQAALEASDAESRIVAYCKVFLTASGEPRRRLISPALAGSRPEFNERLTAEQKRLVKIQREQFAKAQDLKPPDGPLPQPGPAARFTYSNGQFDVVPPGAWRDREAQANLYHARTLELATGLAERLSRTDAVPEVAGSVTALVDVLGTSIANVQPDMLRLASRSITAKARAYSHPSAQGEISVESVSALFELADVLVDLQSFVKTDLEAHERAVRELDLTPEKAADAKIALDIVTDAILSAPEIISEQAQTAFEAAAEVSDTATDRDVKVAVEGDRTLLAANLALAVARQLGRDEEGSTSSKGADSQQAAESPKQGGKPKKPRKRTNRGKGDDPTWQTFKDRIVKRINEKGPDRIADATLDALTSVIRHAPKTVPALAAALALWAIGSPVVTSGALASTVAWIGYELRRKSKQSKLHDATD
jgi:hypothetical protein